MILAYYGEKRDPRYLKSLATPPGSIFQGTYGRDMVAGVRKLGYRWNEECFSTDGAGFRRGISKLKHSVLAGQPVMVGLYDPPIGHFVVLVGIDEARRELTLMDPNEPRPGLRTLSEKEFSSVWHENIVDYRCAIFTRPKVRKARR